MISSLYFFENLTKKKFENIWFVLKFFYKFVKGKEGSISFVKLAKERETATNAYYNCYILKIE